MTDQTPQNPQPPYGQQPPPPPFGGQQPPQYGRPPLGAGGEVPLWAPLYGANMMQAVRRFFQKYARFDGRASRSEYWWWALVDIVVYIVLYVLTVVLGIVTGVSTGDGDFTFGAGAILPGILLCVWFLGTIVPNIALTVRRLHDGNFAGWFYFLVLIPSVGWIIIFVFTLLSSNPLGARFDQPNRG